MVDHRHILKECRIVRSIIGRSFASHSERWTQPVKTGLRDCAPGYSRRKPGNFFYLARTGDQPAGDAYGPEAGVALRAKRYTTSKISANNVEGEIHRLLREVTGASVITPIPHQPPANSGASGARLVVHLAHQLAAGNGRRALASLCVGGGMGIAATLEAL